MKVYCMICNKEIEDKMFCSEECKNEAKRIQNELIDIINNAIGDEDNE